MTLLDPLVEYHFATPPDHTRPFTLPRYSTPWSSIITSTISPSLNHPTLPQGRVHSLPSLDHTTLPHGRVHSSPSLDHFSTKPSNLSHSTTYSTASFRFFFIPHSTRHSSTRKKRRLQLTTRPPGSSIVFNPSQYCVVLSIRASKIFCHK